MKNDREFCKLIMKTLRNIKSDGSKEKIVKILLNNEEIVEIPLLINDGKISLCLVKCESPDNDDDKESA